MKNNLEEERIIYNSANFTIHNKLKAIGENINLRTTFFDTLNAQESGYYVLWNCINKPYITIEQKEGGIKLKEKYYLPNCIRDDPSFLLDTFFNEVDGLKFQNSNYMQHLKDIMEEGSDNDNKKKIYASISGEIEEILKKSLNIFYKNTTQHKLSSTMNDIEFIKPEEPLDPNEKCLENISNKSTTDKLIMITNDEKLRNQLFHHFCGAYCGEHYLIWNCIHNPHLSFKHKTGEKSQNLKIPEQYFEEDCVRNDPSFIFDNFINDKSPLSISVSPNCRRKLNALLENKDNVTIDKKAYSFLLREVEDQLEGHLDCFVKKHYKPRKRKSLPTITPKKEDSNNDIKQESGSSTSRVSPSLSRTNSEVFKENNKKTSNNKLKSFLSIFSRKSANTAKDKK